MKFGFESSISTDVDQSQVDLDSVTENIFHQPTLTENDVAEILTLKQHPEEAPYAS